MRKRDNFCIIVIIVVSLALLIVDIGRTFAYFGTDDNPITSTFNGVITDSSTADNQEFVSNDDNSVAVTVFAGSPVRNNIRVEKTGNGSSNDGGNAAVVVSGNGNFTINNGNIMTDGFYSDAVYVKSGTFTAWLASIQTKSHHSNGLVVTNNSNIIANYLNVETLGDDSATINNISGNVIVNGGSYKTNGDRSPLILASGDVTVNQASTFVSEKSEGIIVNGNHSVTFNNSSLTTTNTSLYNDINRSKGILLYQSSNKNNDYVAVFNATKSSITTNKGDTFYVTNTKATINLTNNTIVNNDESSSYGVSGSNGGDVLLNMSNQSVNGNIVVDDNSKLEMNLNSGSSFEGSINSSNSSDDVALSLSSDSSITLTRDTYISSLENGDDTNSNIHLNGHDLYVNGQKLVIGTGVSDNSGGNGSAETGTNGGTSTTGDTGNGSTSGTGSSGSTTTQGGSSTVSGGTGNGSGTTSGNAGGTTDDKKGSSSDKNVASNNVSGDTSKEDNTKSNSNKVKKKTSGSSSVSGGSKEITQKDLDEIDKNINNIGSNSSSIYVVDDKTLLIINLVGILLIATSSIYLIKNRVLKRINEV